MSDARGSTECYLSVNCRHRFRRGFRTLVKTRAGGSDTIRPREMTDPLHIPAGAELFIGAPAKPLPPAIVEDLRSCLLGIAEIEEAHLPQMYVPRVMTGAAQVLVLVVAPSHQSATLKTVGRVLLSILPAGAMLDVWPLPPGHEMLATVRSAGCQLKAARHQSFWRSWFARRT